MDGTTIVIVVAVLAVLAVVGILATRGPFKVNFRGPGKIGLDVEGDRAKKGAPTGKASITDSKAGSNISARASGTAEVSGSEAKSGDITAEAGEFGMGEDDDDPKGR